jgi:hypothetical protein
MKKVFSLILLIAVSLYVTLGSSWDVLSAYENKDSDVQVGGSDVVVKLLPDDNHGSRHQKFILKLSNSNTVLVAHNIDLAPRIDTIRKSDFIEFYGEYQWSSKGGVAHWTHHDPRGNHPGGWIEHKGHRYE